MLPYLIDALNHCYTIAQRFLGDPAVNSLIGSGSLLIALRQWQVGRRSDPAEPPSPPASDEPAAPPPAAARVLDAVSAHLRSQGFDDERRNDALGEQRR